MHKEITNSLRKVKAKRKNKYDTHS